MTSPDRSLERGGVDPDVTAMVYGLGPEPAEPVGEHGGDGPETEAAPTETVYAPASERVPVPPVPGHRDMIEHPDASTPERVAAAGASEPPFARVPRPSAAGGQEAGGWSAVRPPRLFFGLGVSWATVIGCSVGVWLFLRWRRERQKPINRLRRHARQATGVIRDRVPASKDEAMRPVLGLGAALASALLVVLQQAQARGRQAERAAPDVDWQKRLTQLKKRWGPRRLELEKISISRR
jgi:hypothetical protein